VYLFSLSSTALVILLRRNFRSSYLLRVLVSEDKALLSTLVELVIAIRRAENTLDLILDQG
jgi:hypothetical protein